MNIQLSSARQKHSSEVPKISKNEIENRIAARNSALVKENENIKKEINQVKIAQEYAIHSLDEKNILLQEVNHRVKNNLQVISSLLNLQSNYIEDESFRKVLKECQNRIYSMALIHEKLCESNDFKKIEFSEYIKSLCANLFYSYNIDTNRITLKSELTKLYFEIDKTILYGLIVNELISNSLKHAFPDNRKGEITIELNTFDKDYLLIVRDNGIGLPKHINFRNADSLGLKIVNGLAGQLGSEIELNNHNCTEFRITIPG
jgi:two-component sensor histidine kinase